MESDICRQRCNFCVIEKELANDGNGLLAMKREKVNERERDRNNERRKRGEREGNMKRKSFFDMSTGWKQKFYFILLTRTNKMYTMDFVV